MKKEEWITSKSHFTKYKSLKTMMIKYFADLPHLNKVKILVFQKKDKNIKRKQLKTIK